MDNRKDLILSLAGAMGMSGEKKKERPHYDVATGTIYCGSHVYHTEDLVGARIFFEKHRERAESFGDAACTYYDIALAALEFIEKDVLMNGGKMVVRNAEEISA